MLNRVRIALEGCIGLVLLFDVARSLTMGFIATILLGAVLVWDAWRIGRNLRAKEAIADTETDN